MALQRRVSPADAIEGGDLAHDVAGRGEIADADRVLLRIKILLASRQCGPFADLEAGIHAPQARQSGRERGADEKAGTAGALQIERIDVRRVDEEVGAEELGDFGGGKLA